ncbi:MAG: hypothetical protein ACK4WH_14965 [Phycisphaerales bacterium]
MIARKLLSRRRGVLLTLLVTIGCPLGLADAVHAAIQPNSPPSQPGKPVRRGRIIRQPIVDLEKQAAQRRPGQVLPGDPAPEKFAAPLAAPKAAAPVSPAVSPDSPKLKPAPTPVSPDAGPRPTPPSPPESKPAPAPEPEPAPAASPTPEPSLSVLPGPREVRALTPLEDESSVTFLLTAVDGEPSGIEWRRASGPAASGWTSAVVGDQVSGLYEVRTGLNTEASLIINNAGSVRIGRLARVVIGGTDSKGFPTLTVLRGSIEVQSDAASDVLVRSPDRAADRVVGSGVRVTYDAFRGTQFVRTQVTEIGDLQ